jgi:hypothetical protein
MKRLRVIGGAPARLCPSVLVVCAAACAMTLAGCGGDEAPGHACFGQEPPGRTPEIFAPGVVSEAGYRLHGSPAFSPDFAQVCWPVIPPAIVSTSFRDGVWTEPEPLELDVAGAQAPFFARDGSRLYFQGVRSDGYGSTDIWYLPRTDGSWGDPVNIGPPVNTATMQSQPCMTAGGVLYFTGALEGVGLERGIYRARPSLEGLAEPEPLNSSINTEFIDYCPWVAPDESYLLFASSRPSLKEELYLFVSFRGPDGEWSAPVKIHDAISFPSPARFPSVSPDGRYLFFLSGGEVYWVDFLPVLKLQADAWALEFDEQ